MILRFGRGDIRIALDPSPAPKLPDPFDPLPVSPPAMLIGPDGLPAGPNHIVSEQWLRKRAKGSMQYTDGRWIIPEGDGSLPSALCILPTEVEYPIRITWDGILVDDPGFDGNQPHREDVVRRVREVFDLIWKDKAHDIEQEACEILGVSDLRDCFRRPAGFRQELVDLRAELLRVAKLPYKPNLNDGVLITACPLWKLFRLKSWQSELKACWEKLEGAQYEWAHLA